MITITKSEDFCNSCIRGDKNCVNVRFGTPNFGSVITLCEDCKKVLEEKLKEA